MKLKKGESVSITYNGWAFDAEATEDFDSDRSEFLSVIVNSEPVFAEFAQGAKVQIPSGSFIVRETKESKTADTAGEEEEEDAPKPRRRGR